jgi:pantothenate synthetase
LKEVKSVSGEVLIALAVFVGHTRLIDNITVKV